MTSTDRRYVEVAPGVVPAGIVRDADSLAGFIARELRVPPPRVRWVVSGTPEHADQARSRGRATSSAGPSRLGYYSERHEDSIFVRIGADAFTVAHEARHYWQRLTYSTFWDMPSEPLERDANAYAAAVVARWLEEKAPA
jgi:hypothetical protein